MFDKLLDLMGTLLWHFPDILNVGCLALLVLLALAGVVATLLGY